MGEVCIGSIELRLSPQFNGTYANHHPFSCSNLFTFCRCSRGENLFLDEKIVLVGVGFKPTTPSMGGRPANHWAMPAALDVRLIWDVCI